jgi:hypothetical protein
MSSSVKMWARYGSPMGSTFKRSLVMWDVPADLEIGVIPRRIYCHKELVKPLEKAFRALIATGPVKELKTWDGCYNPRPIRGYEKQWRRFENSPSPQAGARYLSTHAWGLAIDVNAFENALGKKPKLSVGFVKCFTDAGFVWGGTFARLDGMHFELKT